MTILGRACGARTLVLAATALVLVAGAPVTRAATPSQHDALPCPEALTQTTGLSAERVALSWPAQPVPRLCKLELIVLVQAQVNIANPYYPDEIDIHVTFTPPQGEPVRVPGFYYLHQSDPNASGWRVRFTPATEGQWRAVAEMTTRDGRATSQPITFMVSPRAAPGFVRVNPRNPRYLAFDDGRSFFPIGLNLGWWRDDAIKDYTRWLDALQASGATATRIWLAPWAFGLEWKDTGLGNYNNRQLRAHWLDQVITLAEQRDIYIVLGLIPDREFRNGEGGLWAENPYNAANGGPLAAPQDFVTNARAKQFFKQRLRYIAARWGYSPAILAWEYWNEIESTRIETPQLKPWIEEMTAVLREADVNRHLITTSYIGNGDDGVWAMPEIDLMQRHEYGETPKWFKTIPDGFRLTPNAPAKPLLFGEFGFSSAGEPVNPATKGGIHLHNSLWASTFNGFATTALYWWWEDYVDAGKLWSQFKGISTFLTGEDLTTMTPTPVTTPASATGMAMMNAAHALLWLRNDQYNQSDATFKYAMSQSTGQPYRFQLAQLRNVSVELSGLTDGAYRVTWFDTATGKPLSSSRVSASDSKLKLTAPAFRTDIAAKVVRLP